MKNKVYKIISIFILVLNFLANAQWSVKPGESKFFIENNGQFNNKIISKEDIEFGVNNLGYQLYFTKSGFILRYDITETNVKKIEKEEEEQEEEVTHKIKSTQLEYKWQNVSDALKIEALEPVTNLFHYPAKNDKTSSFYNCKAFKKLVYKNLYQNIDLEFIFHEIDGLKYSFIVHPGANISDIKLNYLGKNKPKLIDGRIKLNTDFGTVIEEAPITFYNDSKEGIRSCYSLNKSSLQFRTESYDNSRTIVIDPWVIFPTLPSNNKSLEIQKDPAGNVYVYGGSGNPFTLNKYNSLGGLIWTISLPFVGTWSGDLLVQDNNFSYVTVGSGAGETVKINNLSGLVIWSTVNMSSVEFFRLTHNCDKNKIYAAGGSALSKMSDINQLTGSSTTTIVVFGNAELKSICRAPNGNMYFLTSSNNRLYAMNNSLSILWNVPHTHPFAYIMPLYTVNGGFNGIAANNKFIYTYDGSLLIKRDICNGNFLSSTNVPTGILLMNGGIMVDSCGYVYVGAQNGIYKYDQNLSPVTSVSTTGAVYDISTGINPGELLACGDGFAASINLSVCDPIPFSLSCPPALTASSVVSVQACSSSCAGAATVIPIGTPPFEYLWVPGSQTTSAASSLCPGTYSVYVNDRYTKLCSPVIVNITASSSSPNLSVITPVSLDCISPTKTLNASSTSTGVITYSWSGSGIVSGINTPSPIVNQPGNYTVTLSEGLCSNTAVVTVINNTNTPHINITNALTLSCLNNSFVVTGTSTTSAATYSWSPQNVTTNTALINSAGSYTLVVTNTLNGCFTTSVVTVIQNTQTPNITITNAGTLTCFTSSLLVTGTSSTSGVTYSWIPQNVFTNTTVVATAGNYTLTITDTLTGCSSSSIIAVTQNTQMPNISITTPGSLTCLTNSLIVIGTSTTTGVTYSWIPQNVSTNTAVVISAGNYTFTVSNSANGCSTSSIVSVIQNGLFPNINITNPGTLTCLSNSLIVTGTSTTSGVTYSWTPLGLTTSSALITSAGNYTLDVTHTASGCKTSSVISIIQNTVLPHLSIAPFGTLTCLNTSVNLLGSSLVSGVTYSWSPQGVTTASALASAAGNYTFTVTDPLNGCISNSIVAVTQNTTSPNLNVNPSTTLTCLNPTATLSATSAGNTIVWNGVSLTNATNPVTVHLAGTYSATATDPISGCSTTSIITVSQNTTSPNININPATALTCLNPSTTLTAISSGNTILWNGGSLNNATNPATVNIAGTYSATATDPINGCTTTQTLTLNQNTTSPNVNAGLSQSITCSIPTVTLNGSSSTTGATFSWSPIGINTATAQVNAAGNYTLTVTDPTNGCINSATTTVIASGAFPNISISPTGTLSCLNTSLTLTGSSTTSAASFSWAPQGVNTPSALATTAGNYTFMVTDPLNGCTSSSVITITQNTTSPILNINPSTTLTCLNPIATLSATSAGNTIVWNGGSLTNATNPATINLAGTYSATATNPVNGCVDTQIITVNQNTTVPTLNITASATNLNCNTSSVTLTSSSNVNAGVYLWSTNVLGANNLPSAIANNAGTYSLTVTDPLNGCFNTATVGVSSAPMFSASVVVLSQINCFGNNNGALQIGVVSGGTAPFSITNLNSGSSINNIASFPIVLSNLSAANYSILVSDANGCNQTLFATITQPAALNLALGGNSTLCEGQSTTISSNVSGGSAPYAYVWSPTGGNGANLNTGTTISTNTTFSLLLTDNNGCQAQASIAIVVNPKPNATLINNKLTGCSPVCAGFSLSAQQQPGYVYTWQFTNNQSGSVTSSQLYEPDLCFKEVGSYNAGIVISSVLGCSTTLTYNNLIQVYLKPDADFSFSPTSVTMLEPLVSFTNTSTGASVYGWYNNSSNINSLFSNQANPTYVFQEPGNYLIALVATNGSCSDTALKLIEVEEEFLFYAPNAFTPNEDNLNDTWYPLVTGYKEGSFNLLLFDRWGEQLYQSNDPTSKGWDGFYKKQLCKDDVYIWKVSVKDRKGKLHQFMGYVSLLK